MAKSLYIAEKPSVAQEFARALKMDMKRRDGYQEGEQLSLIHISEPTRP